MSSSMGGYSGLKGPTGFDLGGLNAGNVRSSGFNKRSAKRGGGPGDQIPGGYRVGQLQQFTPEQMQLFKQQFSHLSPDSRTSRLAGGDQEAFEEIEAPAHRQFAELLGGLSSRFSGMGMGARRSSGFQNAATSAASNFAQDLQSNRQGLQRQALRDLMEMSNQLLGQRPEQRALFEKREKKPGFFQSLIGPLAGTVAKDAFSGSSDDKEGSATSKALSGAFKSMGGFGF